jgi:hypothetical protein
VVAAVGRMNEEYKEEAAEVDAFDVVLWLIGAESLASAEPRQEYLHRALSPRAGGHRMCFLEAHSHVPRSSIKLKTSQLTVLVSRPPRLQAPNDQAWTRMLQLLERQWRVRSHRGCRC